MDKLLACPFCGDLNGCCHLDQVLVDGDRERWNTRPIEDALRERAETAEHILELIYGTFPEQFKENH